MCSGPPVTTLSRPGLQHHGDVARTTHPFHGPNGVPLPGRARETTTYRTAQTARGTPRHATWDFSIAANGTRDTYQLLTERLPDSNSSRRTRAHDVVAKGRTRPNVHRLQIWLVDRVYGSSQALRRVAGIRDRSYAAIRPRCLRGPSFSLSPQTKNRSCFDTSCGVRAFQRASQLPAPCPSAN